MDRGMVRSCVRDTYTPMLGVQVSQPQLAPPLRLINDEVPQLTDYGGYQLTKISASASVLHIDRAAVMQAVLGASTALAGLLVVFQGFALSIYSGFPVGTSDSVRAPYKLAVIGVTGIVVLSILVAVGALLWLLGVDLFAITVVAFFIVLVLIVGASIAVTKLVL